MSFFGYSPASSSSFNNGSSSQILGSPNSSSGGGMSGSASPTTGVTVSPTTTPCCEGGRPLVTDPLTGQSVCSCQYDPTRLSLSSYPRLTAYPGSPYAPPTEANPYPTLDSSAFYSPLGGAYAGLKEGSGTGDVSCWPNPGSLQSSYYPYDPTFAAAYGYGGGYDLAARRKNATRESTATLKAWLNEHKKNPYPTKGEKIMLAIITKMTLTQVSTWFANARRRLKKENKMTWEPKNKTDDDDDDMKDDDDDCDSSGHGGGSSSPGLLSPTSNHINNNSIHHHGLMKNELSSSDLKSDSNSGSNSTNKPKIWSLADTAACKTPPPSHQLHPNLGPPHHYSSLGDSRSSNQLSGYSSGFSGMGSSAGGSNVSSFNGPSSSPSAHPGNNASNLNHLNAALTAHHQHQQFVAHQQLAAVAAVAHHHHPHGPAPVTSSWSFALPTYGRPYSSFLTTMSGGNPTGSVNNNGNSPSLQTDTPPQTPPNLKVPLIPASLSQFAHQHQANNSSSHHPYQNHHQNMSGSNSSSSGGTSSHQHHLNSYSSTSSTDLSPSTASGGQQLQQQQQPATTAFKPVLKSSSGGFCV